jgi:hypothetical protein
MRSIIISMHVLFLTRITKPLGMASKLTERDVECRKRKLTFFSLTDSS